MLNQEALSPLKTNAAGNLRQKIETNCLFFVRWPAGETHG